MAAYKTEAFGNGWVCPALMAVLVFAVSCSGREQIARNTNTAAQPRNTAGAPVSSNVAAPEPPKEQAPANIEYFQNDAANRIGKGSTLDRARRRQRPDLNPNASPVPPTLSPAPENSQGAITMLPDGTISEIRIFKSHPSLARVDTFFMRPGVKRVRFTFKDGRVVEQETDRIENLLSVPSATLLQIAGAK